MAEMHAWEVIEAKLSSIYPQQKPKHWGTVQRYAEGGPDPLDGISAYRAEEPSHWHFVTFGFSELNEKKSPNKDVSGWGFELSFRLLRSDTELTPPEWPVPFLQKLARYVFNTKSPFDDEHYIRMGGPITKDQPTKLEALVFTIDPQLGEIKTPNGRVKFLTPIGITAEEHASADQDGPGQLLKRLLKSNRYGVVDLKRVP